MGRTRAKRQPQDPLATLRQREAPTASPPTGRPPAVAAPAPAPRAPVSSGARVIDLALDELYLEHQPRELAPEERLQALIGQDRAQPAALLADLQETARADAYYAEILDGLEGLAATIRDGGVRQPIEVVVRRDRYVVRDGHRRSLASLLAGVATVPAIEVQEPSELEAIARPLVVNLQRSDLTALEKGAALLRLALAVGRRLAEEHGDDPGAVMIEALVGAEADAVESTAAD